MHNTFNFRPVGQGGFTTGTIKENNKPVFNWVYDCGTKSSGSFLKNQITAAKTELYNNTIDLLILSHFDEDHVNGVVELLQNIRCRVLVIPFMTIFERLAIFSKGGAKAEWHRRLLENPQSFFFRGRF
jgi:glyoxylase-like metal-dependent hydrolase (beta-lactamase superfamily II)